MEAGSNAGSNQGRDSDHSHILGGQACCCGDYGCANCGRFSPEAVNAMTSGRRTVARMAGTASMAANMATELFILEVVLAVSTAVVVTVPAKVVDAAIQLLGIRCGGQGCCRSD